MIIRARVVVTMDGWPIENGAVAVSRDRIIDVGKFSEISKRHSGGEVVDLDEQALLPGFINTHCHLDYTCLRGKIPRQNSFADWIRAINAEKAKLSPKDYVASINDGFLEAKRFGTTTIANLTAFPELISQIQAPIQTWWFAELIDVRDPSRANEMVDRAVEQLKAAEHWGLAPHAPFTASANLYRRCQEIADRENILLTTHLAESREEMSMFRDASGRLYEFLKGIGRDMEDCGRETPLERFPDLIGRGGSPNRSEPDWPLRAIEVNRPYLIVHLNELLENDFDWLGQSATKFSVVHCPRSHAYFRHSPFQFQKLRELGFNICLGTDSLASNDDLSLFAEMRAFQKEFQDVSPEEILKMVTVNPARALRQADTLGKIRSDFAADLLALPSARSRSMFEEIVAFEGLVSWSMIGGEGRANPSS
jgi:cytosine/adenosine deaminase-related metal-dependent hydrolase